MRNPRRVQYLVAALALALVLPALADERPIEERCRAEVVELHEFLERWSNAELPPTDEAFARFGDVIAPDFLIIDPEGSRAGRQPIVAAIRSAHGRWLESPGKIRIENFELHHASGDVAVATYEEWHDLPGAEVGRLSSVVFVRDPDAPNGLAWLHLHEVWLEPRSASE